MASIRTPTQRRQCSIQCAITCSVLLISPVSVVHVQLALCPSPSRDTEVCHSHRTKSRLKHAHSSGFPSSRTLHEKEHLKFEFRNCIICSLISNSCFLYAKKDGVSPREEEVLFVVVVAVCGVVVFSFFTGCSVLNCSTVFNAKCSCVNESQRVTHPIICTVCPGFSVYPATSKTHSLSNTYLLCRFVVHGRRCQTLEGCYYN